jgi:signal transduction histidine kinase/ligand-binding sensor domain-containing protein
MANTRHRHQIKPSTLSGSGVRTSMPQRAIWLIVGLFACLIAHLCPLPTAMASAPPASASAPAARTPGNANPTTLPALAPAEPFFETLSDNDSINEGVVTALGQDERGLIWVGTQKGLLRFDGYHLQKMVQTVPLAARVASEFVTALWVGRAGQIALGSPNDGLIVLNSASGQIDSFSHDPQQADSISAGTIWAIAGDAQGGLWIGTDHGLDYLAPGAKTFVHYRQQKGNAASLLDNRVHSLLFDRAGRLWVGSAGGLQRLRRDGFGFEAIASDPLEHDSLAGQEVRALFEAADGKLWLGLLHQGAAWLQPGQGQLHRLPPDPVRPDALSHGWVVAIAQGAADQIWLGTAGGGINVVSASDGTVLQHIKADPAQAHSLAHDTIVPLLRDQAGLIWVGTWGGGLQRCNPANRWFRALWRSPVRPPGSNQADARSMLELADGRIIIGGSENGVKLLDLRRGRLRPFLAEPSGESAAASPRDSGRDGLQEATVLALAQMADGTLWAGTGQNGIWRLPAGSTQWQAMGLPGQQVTRLLVDGSDELWIASNSGLAHWDKQAQRFETFNTDDGSRMWAASFALAKDRRGRLWVGSDIGLWLMQPGAKVLQNIRPQAGQADSLVADVVNGLLVDGNDQLWVATDQGLDKLESWDGKRARFAHVSARSGVQRGGAIGANLMQDARGRIWTGEFVLDPQTMRFYPLSRADGFDIGQSVPGAFGQTRSGLFLFGGTQGLALLDPARYQPWEYQPPVIATALKINDKPMPLALLGPPLVLNPEQRDLMIEFAALDYSLPQKNQYRYRLQGYDREWIKGSEHRSASYGNLAPGEYTLQVQGSNRYGDFSQHQLNIPIQVLAGPWQNGWLRLLMALLVLSSIYLGFRWRVAHMRAQAASLQKLIDARTADILRLSQIGQELTATLDIEQTLERVYNHVSSRLDAHVFRIGVVDKAATHITFIYEIENSERGSNATLDMQEEQRPAVWCVRNRREIITANRNELLNYVRMLLPPSSGKEMETIVYLPLLVEQRVIGCLSVQSPRCNAYNPDQIAFLRVLASYTAIAVSNSSAHSELAAAHLHLQNTQAQLVQSEKMASLGQLVANVAHEINNPIGAVKASGANIEAALEQTLETLPGLLKLLSSEEERLFHALITCARTPGPFMSSREERSATRQAAQELQQHGIGNANFKAGILTQLHAQTAIKDYLPLLLHMDADFILETAQGIAAIISNTGNINLAVAKISKIVFALTSYSRTSHGGEILQVQLRDGIETVLTIYRSQIKTGIELVREFDNLPSIRCHPDELNQVWTNLLHNALQAMNFNGTLSIGLHQIGDEAVVSFSDTGCGIDPAISDKIFDAFFTTKPIGEGSGLGLDIVRKIVEKHHGRIEVKSQVGIGSTFWVYLPLNAQPD